MCAGVDDGMRIDDGAGRIVIVRLFAEKRLVCLWSEVVARTRSKTKVMFLFPPIDVNECRQLQLCELQLWFVVGKLLGRTNGGGFFRGLTWLGWGCGIVEGGDTIEWMSG